MEFTFREYQKILNTLKEQNYIFSDYENWKDYEKSIILRHDVDVSVEKACEMAEFEYHQGVSSVYFILLRGDFYNPFNKRNIELLDRIQKLGMKIGLHFDETLYPKKCNLVEKMEREIHIMEQLLNTEIKSISMHIPSKRTLEANYVINDGKVINSYSNIFFSEFKYISDSKMHWRENVYEIIESGEHQRIHLLTHPIWYNENHISMWDTVSRTLYSQAKKSYEDFEIHTCGVEGKKTLKDCLGETYD